MAIAISRKIPPNSSAPAAMPKLIAAARARVACSRISTRASAISSRISVRKSVRMPRINPPSDSVWVMCRIHASG